MWPQNPTFCDNPFHFLFGSFNFYLCNSNKRRGYFKLHKESWLVCVSHLDSGTLWGVSKRVPCLNYKIGGRVPLLRPEKSTSLSYHKTLPIPENKNKARQRWISRSKSFTSSVSGCSILNWGFHQDSSQKHVIALPSLFLCMNSHPSFGLIHTLIENFLSKYNTHAAKPTNQSLLLSEFHN